MTGESAAVRISGEIYRELQKAREDIIKHASKDSPMYYIAISGIGALAGILVHKGIEDPEIRIARGKS